MLFVQTFPVQGGGAKLSALTSTRITHGTYLDNGQSFVRQDNWTCKYQSDVDVGRLWTGRSVFIPKLCRAGGDRPPNGGGLAIDKWSFPRSSGFIGLVSRIQGRHAHQAAPKGKFDACLSNNDPLQRQIYLQGSPIFDDDAVCCPTMLMLDGPRRLDENAVGERCSKHRNSDRNEIEIQSFVIEGTKNSFDACHDYTHTYIYIYTHLYIYIYIHI